MMQKFHFVSGKSYSDLLQKKLAYWLMLVKWTTSNLYIFLKQVVTEFQLRMNHLGAFEFESCLEQSLVKLFLYLGQTLDYQGPFPLETGGLRPKNYAYILFFKWFEVFYFLPRLILRCYSTRMLVLMKWNFLHLADFVQNLIRKQQYIEAVRFICAYNTATKSQSVDLLREHVQSARTIYESSCKATNLIEIKVLFTYSNYILWNIPSSCTWMLFINNFNLKSG